MKNVLYPHPMSKKEDKIKLEVALENGFLKFRGAANYGRFYVSRFWDGSNKTIAKKEIGTEINQDGFYPFESRVSVCSNFDVVVVSVAGDNGVLQEHIFEIHENKVFRVKDTHKLLEILGRQYETLENNAVSRIGGFKKELAQLRTLLAVKDQKRNVCDKVPFRNSPHGFIDGQHTSKNWLEILNSDVQSLFSKNDNNNRVFNCFNNAKIFRVWQLTTYSEQELLKYRNFGKKSLSAVHKALNSKGLHLGTVYPKSCTFEEVIEETYGTVR
jgi:hypothetical protein